jgi:hypothetical protein
MAILKDFQDKKQHAKEFDVCERTIDRWCDQPDGLPHTAAGRRKLFHPEWTRAWLIGRRVQRNPANGRQRRRQGQEREARSGP